MQQTKIKDHPRQAAVTDIIIAINKKQKENHNKSASYGWERTFHQYFRRHHKNMSRM